MIHTVKGFSVVNEAEADIFLEFSCLPASWEIRMQVKKQQLEQDMEPQTGSKRKRSVSRMYIVNLLI